jgi:hypothetical protein
MMGTQQQTQGSNSARTIGAVVLIAIGAFFLANNVFGFSWNFWDIGWPLFVLVPGLAFLFFAITGDKNAVGLIYPGAIITGTGAILLYQNMTGNWESWAYTWALYPLFVGIGLSYEGYRRNHSGNIATGRNMIMGGFIGFLVFGAFFELMIFNDNDMLFNLGMPLVLMAAGAYLLLGRRNNRVNSDYVPLPKRKNDADVSPELRRKIDEALEEPETPVR